MPKLKVVRTELTPAAEVRRKARAHAKPRGMIACPSCGGREYVNARTGALEVDGRAVAGTSARLCVVCLMQGRRVEMM
ncbi:MAG TPA: hypothetical protein VN324_00860 [Quisquiliibacterium sp.]|nr:hypothetical protein [Quisquiliibacterium sp.]